MGAGNYLPHYGEDVPYYHINVDLPWREDQDEDERRFDYEDMMQAIAAVLPESFVPENRWRDGEYVLWKNGLYELRTLSWNASEVLIVRAADAAPAFARNGPAAWKRLRAIAGLVFDTAADHGDPWARTGPWTGRRYHRGDLHRGEGTVR